MSRQQILEKLNEKLSILSMWNPEYYKLLSDLSSDDIENQTEKAIDSTLALEYIFSFSEINFSLTDYELDILKCINDEFNTNKLEIILEIIKLCGKYTDLLEIDEINHPVCEYYNAKEMMMFSSYNYYEKLENLYFKYPSLINKAYYEMTTAENIPELNNVSLYFLFQNGSVENIIYYLRKYVITKLQDNCSENKTKNYINTEIMKSLDEYSEIYLHEKNSDDNKMLFIDEITAQEYVLDDKFMKMYGELYKSYLENKMYSFIYRNKIDDLSIYEQKCKKL